MASEDTNKVLVNKIINQLKFLFVKIKIANQRASKSTCHDMQHNVTSIMNMSEKKRLCSLYNNKPLHQNDMIYYIMPHVL